MSLVKTSPVGLSPAEAFKLDPELLETPAAKRAMLAGLLQAKRHAMQQVERLARFGRPLLVAIVFVSFLHVFETIAGIRPQFVEELRLPSWLYHAAAALLTSAIDLAALYTVSAHAAALLALPVTSRRGVWFFLSVTFLLNAAFVVRYAPSLPAWFRSSVLPVLDIAFVVLLPAFVPVAIVAVESAAARLQLARLRLLVEVTALTDLVEPSSRRGASGSAQNGTGSAKSAVVSEQIRGGRRSEYELTDLLHAAGSEPTFSRDVMAARLGCSAATLTRLLSEGVKSHVLVREARGLYRVVEV